MLSKPLISPPVVVTNSRKKAAKTGEKTGGTDQRSETVEERQADRETLIQVRSSLAALTRQTQTQSSHIEPRLNKNCRQSFLPIIEKFSDTKWIFSL